MSNLEDDKFAASLSRPTASYEEKSATPETTTARTEAPTENIKGVVTAGWVLAFLLPFIGIILNTWLWKNADEYSYSKPKTIIATIISIILSLALLFGIFTWIFSLAVVPPVA